MVATRGKEGRSRMYYLALPCLARSLLLEIYTVRHGL
jgi:hypothetical protein